MRLSWNEIRERAARFADEWKDARYERGEAQSFYNDFFEVFGVPRRRVAAFEEPVKVLGERRGFIDLFWKGTLLVEQKSAGGSLVTARRQALDYFPGLKDHELPRYLLVSDFQNFELADLETGGVVRFTLRQLPKFVQHFAFMLGVQARTFKDQDPANIAAAELMGQLHDKLYASGYANHDLERLLVRLLFCLFADSTGIFELHAFGDLIANRTSQDGSDVGHWLTTLFDVLNTSESQRQTTLDDDLQAFPFVNGELFAERLAPPAFNAVMRGLLLEACEFKWEMVSPAIFGSLFQSVMDPRLRRAQGAHYTTERNILKLIQPLFLDELRAEFEQLRVRRDTGRRAALDAFHAKLGKLKFLDPACGCGNFLIIAYRELRELEIEVLKALQRVEQLELDPRRLARLDVDQFYGIEIGEFPARIAEVAMWMTDHIMNNRLSFEFGLRFVRIPLKKSPHIHQRDALEMDWNEVLPAQDCNYVLGNPPFGGSKQQSITQREQVRRVARLGGSGGTLDYVTAWFIKAGEYAAGGRPRIAFVATNSITQGEQVGQLWPILFERHGLEIAFAHRTFAWGSDARGQAHVHVVIVGLARHADEPATKRLFTYDDPSGDPTETALPALSPYLFDAGGLADKHLVVREAREPLAGQPLLLGGSQPIDNGNYIFDFEQRLALLRDEPRALPLLRPFVGSEEFINGRERWILWFGDTSPSDVRAIPLIASRIRAVRAFRKESKRRSTLSLADRPTEYCVTVVPDHPFLVIPEVSSERRDYVPIGWLHPPAIPSSLVTCSPESVQS